MRKAAGYFLFVLSCVAWVGIALLPFFDLSLPMVAATTSALIIGGEILFLLSVILLGKKFLKKIKELFVKVRIFRRN